MITKVAVGYIMSAYIYVHTLRWVNTLYDIVFCG